MDTNENTVQAIGSLAEYTWRIMEITQKQPENAFQEFFYRGHANKEWELEPTAYRVYPDGKSYRDVELQMYQEMLRRNPQAFQNCNTTFECLIKMQHYGLPTRLLDLTQSPLVALYFCCCEKNGSNKNNEEKCDGEVLIVQATKTDVYFQDELPSHIFWEFEFKSNFVNLLKDITFYFIHDDKFFDISKKENYHPEIYNIIMSLYNSLLRAATLNIDASIEERYYRTLFFLHKSSAELDTLASHKIENIRSQAQTIRAKFFISMSSIIKKIINEYKLPFHFRDQTLIQFLESYSEKIIIYPPLNNERIQRQRGAFICFPRYHYKKRSESSFPTEHITIAADKKQAILDELKTMGITRANLFPELDVQADDIKNNVYSRV